jgi:hypothetical protein
MPHTAVEPVGQTFGPVGRQRALRVIDGLFPPGGGTGSALVLLGDPGIGKSALLAEAGRKARTRELRVLATTGVEAEAQLPFAALHLLLRPVLDHVAALPAVERGALLSAIGLGEGTAPELYLIAAAVVRLLDLVDGRRRLAVLVDDAQWLDPQTHEVLTFVARHAGSHRFVIVCALRTGHEMTRLTSGVPVLEVRALGAAAAP